MKYTVSYYDSNLSRWVPYYESTNWSDVCFYERMLRYAGLMTRTAEDDDIPLF